MFADGWLNLFRVILYCGLVAVTVGTLGTNILSCKIDKQKDRKIDDLLEGNQKLQESDYKIFQGIDQFQKQLEDVLKKSPPVVIESNKTSWNISQILTGMQPDALIMLAIILKYKPNNNLVLTRLLIPFEFSPIQYSEALRRLMLTGLVFVGNPADVKQSSPLYAPISVLNDKDMYEWIRGSWKVLFKNHLDIEPSFESIREN